MHYYKKYLVSKAINKFLKCKQIFEEVFPSNHPGLARIYNNLANILNDQGKSEESLTFYLKSKQIFEEVLPCNHPDLATIYNNLGLLLFENERKREESMTFYLKFK